MRKSCPNRPARWKLLTLGVLFGACRAPEPLPSSPGAAKAVVAPPATEATVRQTDPLEARLVASANGARRLELVRADGTLATRFFPGFFNQSLLVPDVEGNTGGLVVRNVAGTDVLAASVHPESERALVAVRGFIYAEVSTDLVFLIEARQPASPPDPDSVQPVFYDGPEVVAEAAEGRERGRRAFRDVTQVAFAEDGRLLITLADASGGVCHLEYDATLQPVRCSWVGGESRQCPAGVAPPKP